MRTSRLPAQSTAFSRRNRRVDPLPEAAARHRLDDAVLTEWATRFGTADELLLLAASVPEAENLNHTARAALRSSGRLTGPPARVGGLEVAAGDRVVAGQGGIPGGGSAGIPEGCPGDVRLVSAGGGAVVVDFPTAGLLRLSGPALAKARLRYGYAVPAPPGVGRRLGSLRLAAPGDVGIDVAAG